MIARHWKGVTKKEREKDYFDHLQKNTLKQLTSISGFVSAQVLKRIVDEGVEFLIITQWQSIEAIQQFAGTDIKNAVVPQEVHNMMITYEKEVRHYAIALKV